MKKFIVGLFSIFAIVLCLVACGEKEITLKDLSIEGQKVEFSVGDTFETGDLKVTATYSDDSTKDVTADAKVEQNANMKAAGTYAVLVSYENITKAYSISVKAVAEVKLQDISIEGQKEEFLVGDTFDKGDLKVTATYSDGTTKDVTTEVTVEQSANMNAAGSYVVLVSYENITKAYTISVAALVEVTLQDIAIEGQKVEFTVGDTFDKGDLKVTATYSDGTTKDVTADATVEQNVNMEAAGSYVVLVSYENITKAYTVSVAGVIETTIQSLTIEGQKVEFTVGDAFETGNLKVTATYSDGTTKDVTTEAEVNAKTNMNAAGSYVVLVSYENITQTYTITVAAVVEVTLQSIAIEGQKVEFFVGDTFDKGNLKVTATYSDGTTKDVTADAKIEQSANMNAAGSYLVFVSYQNFTKNYTVSVTDNTEIQSIIADISGAKTVYHIDDTIDYTNVQVIEVYKNAANDVTIKYGEISKYSVKITDEEGKEITGPFEKLGTYTVSISKDNLETSYDVNVEISYKSYATVGEAIVAALKNSNKVLSGTFTYKQDGFFGSDYNFLFGKDYLEVSVGESTTYYQMLENGDPFGITVHSDGSLSVEYDAVDDSVVGVNISSLFYHIQDVYGAENLLAELYSLSTEEDAICYHYQENIKLCPTCGYAHTYEFSLDTILSELLYVQTTVQFTLDGLEETLESLTVSFKGYFLDDMVKDEETGEYTVKDGITDFQIDTSISAKQVAGERTKDNPYNADALFLSSFDLADAEGNVIGEEVTAQIGTALELKMVNIAPENAAIEIDSIKVTITDLEGKEFVSAYGYYDEYSKAIIIKVYKKADLKVTVSSTNVEKTFILKTAYAELTSLSAGVVNEWGDLTEDSKAKTFENTELIFGAIANSGADANYTAALQEESDKVTLESYDDKYYSFTATEAGTYVVVLTSTVNSAITATLEITVEEPADMTEVLSGEYVYDYWGTSLTYVFTPESEGALNGIVTVSDGSATATYTYSYDEDWMSLNVRAKDVPSDFYYSVSFDETTQSLWCKYGNFTDGKLERKGKVVEGTLSGTYAYKPSRYESYSFTFNADGSGSFDLNYFYQGTLEWELDDDNNITFSNIIDDYYEEAGVEYEYTFTGTYNVDDDTVSITYNVKVNDEYEPVDEGDTLELSK